MDFAKSTTKYEKWLAEQIPIVAADLKFKHEQMRSGTFPFLRATFYRWVQLFNKDDAAKSAPELLSVGDLHVENYGTWRDAEGRLVWGINDFDEAAIMPYTNDLVRLVTSGVVAASGGHMRLGLDDACEAVLDGYRTALEEKGRPFVLEADHMWLRRLATGVERAPDRFWAKLTALPKLAGKPIATGLEALTGGLPDGSKPQLKARRAGLGSLGHPRYVALTEFEGGLIAREAKLLAPSSVYWAAKESGEGLYSKVVKDAVRCHDPFLALHGMWVTRRLAPSCSRIELVQLPEERDELKMVRAMGYELGNVHLATPSVIPSVLKHLGKQPKKWLQKTAKRMAEGIVEDFEVFRKAGS